MTTLRAFALGAFCLFALLSVSIAAVHAADVSVLHPMVTTLQ